MPSKTPAVRIRAAREALGWSQEELAASSELTAKTIWAAEKGRLMSDRTLRKIANGLGLEETTFLSPARKSA